MLLSLAMMAQTRAAFPCRQCMPTCLHRRAEFLFVQPPDPVDRRAGPVSEHDCAAGPVLLLRVPDAERLTVPFLSVHCFELAAMEPSANSVIAEIPATISRMRFLMSFMKNVLLADNARRGH